MFARYVMVESDIVVRYIIHLPQYEENAEASTVCVNAPVLNSDSVQKQGKSDGIDL